MKYLLFINNIGGLEILVILLFVLIFFGAKSIPGLARTLGKGMREIQHASDDIKREIQSTSNNIKKDLALGDDVKKVIADIEAKPQQLLDQIELNVQDTKKDLDTQLTKLVDTAKQSELENLDNNNQKQNT
jgi:sec-independent protein translocase protein TatA